MIILWRLADTRGPKLPPSFRVKCPECFACYVMTAWPKQAEESPRCTSCAQKARQEREHAAVSP